VKLAEVCQDRLLANRALCREAAEAFGCMDVSLLVVLSDKGLDCALETTPPGKTEVNPRLNGVSYRLSKRVMP
jgi:hypothetical protein